MKRHVYFLLFSLLTGWGMKAQCIPTCNMVVGGTNFEALYEDEEVYRMLGSVVQLGPLGGLLETSRIFLTDYASFGTATSGYGIVNNPTTVNPAFYNIDEPMMLISNVGANVSILSYSVSGLRANTTACITVEGYIVSPITCSVNTAGFRMVIDPQGDGAWTFAQANDASGSTTVGQKFTLTMTRNLGAATGFTFNLRSGITGWSNCIVLGISKVEIKGCLNPKIKSSEGNEVCQGEQVRLGLDRDYYVNNYQWEKSPDGSTGWIPVGGNAKSMLDEVNETAWYRCVIDGVESETFKVAAIGCGEIKPGVPASRKTIYHENFGTFLSPTDYVDAFGTSGTAINWQTCEIPYIIPAHSCFRSTPDDGQYVISTLRLGVMQDWMRGGMTEDASGDPNGGVLAINIALGYVGEIYRYQIDNLCPNVNLFFEVYVANASYASGTMPPNIKISILKTDGTTVLGSVNSVLTATTFGWQRVTIPPFSTTETSVVLSIHNITPGTSNGSDLLMDDIILRVGSLPNVEVYSNLGTLKQDTVISGPATLQVGAVISNLVQNTYGGGGNVRYIFQRSSDGITWNNITGIVTTPSIDIDMDNYQGIKNYFRIAVADEGVLQNYMANPNYESYENNCNTSVSRPLCVTRNTDIPNIKILSSEGNMVCSDELTLLTLDQDYEAPYNWEKSTVSATGPWIQFSTEKSTWAEVGETTWYRCTTQGITSQVLQIDAMTCCESGGLTGSQKIIYFDNFVIFTSPTIYIDAWGNTMPTDGNFCKELPGGVPEHTPYCGDAIGFQSGNYRISPFNSLPAWMNGGAGMNDADALGDPLGGILCIDVKNGYTGVIHERRIDGLCSEKEFYAQIAFAPGNQASTAADIKVTVTDTSAGRTEISTFRQNGNFSLGWQIIKIPPFVLPEGVGSVYLRIESFGTNWVNGEDLLFDNIIFSTCRPPRVDAYSDLNTLKQDTVICGQAILQAGVVISEFVKKAYGGEENVRYIFQQSADVVVWNNITGIVNTPSFDINMDDYPGQTNYFRITAGTEGSLQHAIIDPNYEDFDGMCRNISISDPFRVTRDAVKVCGCTDPRAWNYDPQATDSDNSCLYSDEENTYGEQGSETPVDTVGTKAKEECKLDINSPITRAYIDGIEINGNKVTVEWVIEQENGKKVTYSAEYSVSRSGFMLFYLSIICENGLKSSNSNIITYTISATYYVDLPTGISQPEAETNNLVVYPNPFTDKLTVLVKGAKAADIALYSIEGNLLATYRNLNEVEIATSKLPAGVYVVKVTAGGKTESVTVVKK